MNIRTVFGCLFASAVALLLFPGLSAKAAAPRPNFVVIQTDDQPLEEFDRTWVDLYGRTRPIMSNTMRLIRDQGVDFSQYMTPFPLCAPSRASLFSGQYAQNHEVIRIGGPRGGWDAYRSNPIHGENIGVWLQRAGYRTAHFGKFMNYYGGMDDPAETEVPPGWDRWVSDATDNSTRDYYGYRQNVDGQITPRLGYPFYDVIGGRDPLGCPDLGLASCNYHSDAMSLQAADEIESSGSQPFYVQVDFHTPHGDSHSPAGPEPAVRHYDTALRTPPPRPPGYNEADVSDKPWFLREGVPRLRAGETNILNTSYRKSIEALQSVDDGVKRIIDSLRESGQLENTYVIFISDNGFFLGQHRIHMGKLLPYEPALRVPMVIRGPGIKPGVTSAEPVANQDIAPTVLGLAGALGQAHSTLDGRSLVPFWKQPAKRSRRPILISSYLQATRLIPGDYPDDPIMTVGLPAPAGKDQDGAHTSIRAPNHNYVGIRLGPYKYVRYEKRNEGELYILRSDPHELNNRYGDPRVSNIRNYMSRQLRRLRGCAGAGCRANAPPWPRPPVAVAADRQKRAAAMATRARKARATASKARDRARTARSQTVRAAARVRARKAAIRAKRAGAAARRLRAEAARARRAI